MTTIAPTAELDGLEYLAQRTEQSERRDAIAQLNHIAEVYDRAAADVRDYLESFEHPGEHSYSQPLRSTAHHINDVSSNTGRYAQTLLEIEAKLARAHATLSTIAMARRVLGGTATTTDSQASV